MGTEIRVIIGLGNPGSAYYENRHSIGFRVVDELAHRYQGLWRVKGEMAVAEIVIHRQSIMLIKPQTFMNTSGRVMHGLAKAGITASNILVVHDELEMPFGHVVFKIGGSARGHNGLRSLIAVCGPEFGRIRCGIGRPDNKEDVPRYVLQNFSESPDQVQQMIDAAVRVIEELITQPTK